MSDPVSDVSGPPAPGSVGPDPRPPTNVIPTAEQVERFIAAADEELGPECCDAWVQWIRETLRAAARAAR